MPSKNSKKPLSHTEIWDDSALIQSWDDALEEYKVGLPLPQYLSSSHLSAKILFAFCVQLYHSIHARGEKVADVLREAEMEDLSQGYEQVEGHTTETLDLDDTQVESLEDGEIDIKQDRTSPQQETNGKEQVKRKAQASDSPDTKGSPEDAQVSLESPPPVEAAVTDAKKATPLTSADGPDQPRIPHNLVEGVQDEGLKNLMMSWYYAGYYTGLFQGQQQGRQESLTASHTEGSKIG
ncbi:MAG: hypothetical protein M1837_000449 [Sclerophora amabilis]|nr:MAG: hypothetical protein M1837_000449 [Sclerophora amabilis]